MKADKLYVSMNDFKIKSKNMRAGLIKKKPYTNHFEEGLLTCLNDTIDLPES